MNTCNVRYKNNVTMWRRVLPLHYVQCHKTRICACIILPVRFSPLNFAALLLLSSTFLSSVFFIFQICIYLLPGNPSVSFYYFFYSTLFSSSSFKLSCSFLFVFLHTFLSYTFPSSSYIHYFCNKQWRR